jgi:hypothetical protein
MWAYSRPQLIDSAAAEAEAVSRLVEASGFRLAPSTGTSNSCGPGFGLDRLLLSDASNEGLGP